MKSEERSRVDLEQISGFCYWACWADPRSHLRLGVVSAGGVPRFRCWGRCGDAGCFFCFLQLYTPQAPNPRVRNKTLCWMRVYFSIFDLLTRLWPAFLLRLLVLARLIVRFWRCRLVQEAKWAQFLSFVFFAEPLIGRPCSL